MLVPPVDLVTGRQIVDFRPGEFDLRSTWALNEVISRKGAIPAEPLVLLDSVSISKRECLFAGLYLRNAGHTVFVGDPNKVPQDLVSDIHANLVKTNYANPGHQLLLMEDVIDDFGDVSAIVQDFETTLES